MLAYAAKEEVEEKILNTLPESIGWLIHDK